MQAGQHSAVLSERIDLIRRPQLSAHDPRAEVGAQRSSLLMPVLQQNKVRHIRAYPAYDDSRWVAWRGTIGEGAAAFDYRAAVEIPHAVQVGYRVVGPAHAAVVVVTAPEVAVPGICHHPPIREDSGIVITGELQEQHYRTAWRGPEGNGDRHLVIELVRQLREPILQHCESRPKFPFGVEPDRQAWWLAHDPTLIDRDLQGAASFLRGR